MESGLPVQVFHHLLLAAHRLGLQEVVDAVAQLSVKYALGIVMHISVSSTVVVKIRRNYSFFDLLANLSVRVHKSKLIFVIQSELNGIILTILCLLVNQIDEVMWRSLAALKRTAVFTKPIAPFKYVGILESDVFVVFRNIRLLLTQLRVGRRVLAV